jgi:hypothetical protein
MRISNVKSREGKTPDAETDTDHSNGGELDDQVKIMGKVKEAGSGDVLGRFPWIPFRYARQGMITILGDNGVILQKNGGNKLEMDVYFKFPHRSDNNKAMKDSLTFDLDLRLYQKCDIVDSGTGFVKVSENFNGNETKTGYARARFGDGGGSTQTWEVAVGNDQNVDDQDQYDWTSGEKVPFKVHYSGDSDNEMEFMLDGTTVSTTLDNSPNGRIGIQGKADEATVQVHDAMLYLKGPKKIVSNIDLTASNDDASNGDTGGRALNYLVANTKASQLQDGFTIKGMAEVTLQDDFPGGDEDVALDVVLE